MTVERVWPPDDRRERIPGGWMEPGSCGSPHLGGRGFQAWLCPVCSEPAPEGCAMCEEIGYLDEFGVWPIRVLAARLGVAERTVYRHLNHRGGGGRR